MAAPDRNLTVKVSAGGEPVPRWADPNNPSDKYQAVPQFDLPLVVVPAVVTDSQFVVGASAIPIPAAPLTAGAVYALLEIRGGTAGTDGIRWFDDGKVPTSGATGNGHELVSPTYYWIRQNLAGWQMIRMTTVSPTAVLSYYKPIG